MKKLSDYKIGDVVMHRFQSQVRIGTVYEITDKMVSFGKRITPAGEAGYLFCKSDLNDVCIASIEDNPEYFL